MSPKYASLKKYNNPKKLNPGMLMLAILKWCAQSYTYHEIQAFDET